MYTSVRINNIQAFIMELRNIKKFPHILDISQLGLDYKYHVFYSEIELNNFKTGMLAAMKYWDASTDCVKK